MLPSSDEYGNFHFESGWVSFDNLHQKPWLNLKAGKFELDDVVSEKRMSTLSQVGGIYQIYHYLPLIDPLAFAASTQAAERPESAPPALGWAITSWGLNWRATRTTTTRATRLAAYQQRRRCKPAHQQGV